MTVRVKICGITRVEDARAAIAAGADMLGLNFYAKSPRYVEIDRARKIRAAIGSSAALVGVFVNAARAYVDDRLRAAALDMIQFSGDEDDAMLAGWPVPTILTHRLKPGYTSSAMPHRANYVLLDAFDAKLRGGTGCRIPLDQLRRLDLSRAFVAGGLNPDNVAEVAALEPYAVDCAGGVESSPGVKDHDKLRSFITNAKRSR
ncbi:MAG: phosphoribosylanthranilate isomerase [Candidatus Binatus sp.]|jgi:phosphoribosylanthranilate isomerase|uniref:phosphoribosylanthranilate isomerase n=1 Tax=Candidatus Binatus sp. TaxID=2811406 RepID=UPI003C71102C